ncbi:multiple RNA-binding domain-containing protein 1-like [Hibiscus syriacus]|uniref:Multiple RNA-binding domain-containing protein 1-like n=1 Tax=Hibiscus syriacus TaxID=106335 RepID=A0A6A2YK87_HIBSY|nr:multiple RNA-binding domain-containing protein 1-like [Hibiscus syriacus]
MGNKMLNFEEQCFVLMECLREKVEHLSLIPGMDKSAAFLDYSNLLKFKLGEVMSIEERKQLQGSGNSWNSAIMKDQL